MGDILRRICLAHAVFTPGDQVLLIVVKEQAGRADLPLGRTEGHDAHIVPPDRREMTAEQLIPYFDWKKIPLEDIRLPESFPERLI